MERWIAGYAEILRPQLFAGRFQTPDKDPPTFEDRVVGLARTGSGLGWRGSRLPLNKHYRATRPSCMWTPCRAIFPNGSRPSLTAQDACPASRSPRGQAPHTVHPLLIYAELVLTGSDRAREAASELRERFLASP
jgi:hypothetical protein